MNDELGKKWSLPVTTTFMLEINLNTIKKFSFYLISNIT
jgi:hypothetical protein